jgi:hypothetical protein
VGGGGGEEERRIVGECKYEERVKDEFNSSQ